MRDALVSGAVAAAALTAMHECTRKTMPDPPRADLLGMRAIARAAGMAGYVPPDHLRGWAMAGDLLGNALYYSSVGCAPKSPLLCGAAAGAVAGAGLLALPGPLGLGSDAVNRTRPTQLMGAGMYLAAGLIAGAVYRLLRRR
jgi:hypothetical protein